MSDDTERDAELRRRLAVLQEQMKQGKVACAEHLRTDMERSLSAIRMNESGEIDLSTVDGRTRAMAMAVTVMADREEMKESTSMSDVQELYFEYLEKNFGPIFEQMKQEDLDPHMASVALSSDENFLKENAEGVLGIFEDISHFWENVSEPTHAHVEDSQEAKLVFGGSLFPSYTQSIASTCGLYSDTIILPDPFLRSSGLTEYQSPSQRAYYVIKNALNLLSYKELALADLNIPIVSVVPDRSILDQDEKSVVHSISESDALRHLELLFGRTFESIEDYFEYVDPFDSVEKLVQQLSAPDRALFDSEWPNDAREQLSRGLEESAKEAEMTKHPGHFLVMNAIGRMMQANDLLLRSQRLAGTPLIDAPTSWQYFQWKLEYDSSRFDSSRYEQLHMVRGLQAASEYEMQWLGNVPHDALIEIRSVGALDEIREILGRGISELTQANPDNFHRTTDQIVDNIHHAFDEHRENLKMLNDKKWSFAGQDIGSWLVVGSLEVAAAATGAPMFGLIALAANQFVDMPKLKDFPEKVRELKDESEKINKSPVGLFFALQD